MTDTFRPGLQFEGTMRTSIFRHQTGGDLLIERWYGEFSGRRYRVLRSERWVLLLRLGTGRGDRAEFIGQFTTVEDAMGLAERDTGQ